MTTSLHVKHFQIWGRVSVIALAVVAPPAVRLLLRPTDICLIQKVICLSINEAFNLV